MKGERVKGIDCRAYSEEKYKIQVSGCKLRNKIQREMQDVRKRNKLKDINFSQLVGREKI